MTTKKTTGFETFFSADKFNEMFQNFQTPVWNIEGLMDMQRKNVEAVAQANQRAFEGMQTAMKAQADAVNALWSEQSNAAKDALSAGTPEQSLQKQAEFAKKTYETSVKNVQNVGEILSKVNDDVVDILSKRMNASVNELKKVMDQTAAATKAA